MAYENFTERSRKVMQLASLEARRLNHDYIGTEHILLGLAREPLGIAVNVLTWLHVDLRRIRTEVEKLVAPGPDLLTMGKLPLSRRVNRLLEYAAEEAVLFHNVIGTEHLLLGVLRDRECVGAQVLMSLGLKLEDVREEVLQLVGLSVPAAGVTAVALQVEPVTRSPAEWMTAVTGELGELASLLKMRNRERDGISGNKFSPADQQIADELADVVTYLDLLADALGVDLGRAVVEKFNEVSKRLGFSDRIEVASGSPLSHARIEGYEIYGNQFVAIAMNVNDAADPHHFGIDPDVNNNAFIRACGWAYEAK